MANNGPFGPVVNGTQIVFYEYRPNQPVAIAFVVLFALATVGHLVYLFLLRAWFFVPFILGGLCEIFGYFGRAWSSKEPVRSGPFILQNVLLLAGPPFLAASIYMTLGRITTALNAQHLSLINPRWLTKIYVLIDIGCIFSQFIGALMPVSGDPSSVKKGQTILIAGLVTQLAALSFFIFTSWYVFHRIKRDPSPLFSRTSSVNWENHFKAIGFVTLVMIVRSVVRSIEFLQGQGGYVISHEIFIYVFDAALMFLIMAVFLLIHPGRLVRDAGRAKSHERDSQSHVRLQSWQV
ncbi:RTA1 like protein-domain-containing protein [Halenospora varia]|nr:RTA1 like protein-domain-containing protein [Halenospora varia]